MPKNINLYTILYMLFAVIYIQCNLAAVKIGNFFGYPLDTGTIFFPLLYIINDIITETYGFKHSRFTIWSAIFCNVFFLAGMSIAVVIPAYDGWEHQAAFDFIYTSSPKIVFASVLAFAGGEYFNSYILSNLKNKYRGKYFAGRALTSTFIGASLESVIFSFIAFYDEISLAAFFEMNIMLVGVKVLYELLTLPITTKIIQYIKEKDKADDYEKDFNFLPNIY